MTEAFTLAAFWLALAVLATILANHLHVSMALVEICIGIAAGAVAEHYFGPDSLGANVDWLRFFAAMGAVVLTFLAGAELEPSVLRSKWKRGYGRRAGRFLRTLPRLCGDRTVWARLGCAGQLAGGRGSLYHLDGRGLRSYAGDRLQQNGLREGHPWGLFHQ